MFDWNDLKYFLAVARHGSTIAAGKALGLSQSTVHRRLEELERRLGRALVTRQPSGYRLTEFGQIMLPYAERIEVTGDPRFDSALQRARAIQPTDPLVALGRGAPTLVAGSTWSEDERVLLPAYGAVRAARPEVRLIIVPHEPTPDHLASLDAIAVQCGLEAPRRVSASAPRSEANASASWISMPLASANVSPAAKQSPAP